MFLKPSRKKLLVFALFLLTGLLIEAVPTIFGTGLSAYCVPTLGSPSPDTYQNPQTLSAAWELANTPDPCSYGWPGIDSPLVKAIQYVRTTVLLLMLPYVLACIAVTVLNKIDKKDNRTA
jgi:hypothetical protein